MYYLKCTFDPDFTDLMMYLKGKYPKKLFDLDGIGDKHTDFCQFSKDFFTTKTTTSDVSVDDNANVDDLSVIAYHTEFPKPLFKLNSYYVLWKKLKQLYGLAKANQIVERQLVGDIYINDFHGIGGGFAYCFNYSTFDIMLNGLPMIKKIKSIAPKYLYSFKSQLEQFVVIASNSTLGATGLADLFIVMSHYVDRILETKKDAGFTFATEEDCWKYVEENLVSFIYTINQPMRGNQSLVYDEKIVVNDKNIKIGEFVESYINDHEMEKDVSNNNLWTYSLNRETGKLENKKIKGVIKHKTENLLVEYILTNGEKVKSTDNHSFFTRDDLNIKEVKRNERPKNLLIPFNFISEDETTVGKLKIENHNGRLNVPTEIEMTPEFCYFLGQYLGDGGADGSGIGIATFNETISNSLNEDFKKIGDFKTRINEKNKFCFEISLGKDIVETIKKEFKTGSHKKILSKKYAYEKNIMYLIGGYIDSDGFIGEKECVLTSCNKDLLNDISFILLSRGILAIIDEKNHTGYDGKQEPKKMYKLRILANDCKKLNKFTRLKKFNEREIKLDYSRKFIDFSGLYTMMQKEYDIYSPYEYFDISYKSRDVDNLTYKEVVDICKKLNENIEKLENKKYLDDELGLLLLDLNHHKNYRNKYPIDERIKILKELKNKLFKFIYALPVKIKNIHSIDFEEFVYDISVEDNENFLTSSNIYAHNSPFTNVSIYDDYFLDSLLPGYSYDGKAPNKEIVKKIQELFVDIMNKEMKRTPVTFPVTTACFSVDDEGSIQDEDFLKFISEKNLEFGFINLYCGKSSTLSSCCRLRSDTENRFFVEETFFEIETSEGIRKFSSKEALQVKNLQTNEIETKYIDEIKNCFENFELVV